MLPTPSPPFRAGKYELQLVAMCDCYVGCDRTLPVRIKVSAMTRAAMEGRDARSQKAQQGRRELDSDEEDDDDKGSKGGCRRRRSRRGSGGRRKEQVRDWKGYYLHRCVGRFGRSDGLIC